MSADLADLLRGDERRVAVVGDRDGAAETIGQRLPGASVETSLRAGERYDAVVVVDAFEESARPEELLGAIREALAEGGIVVASLRMSGSVRALRALAKLGTAPRAVRARHEALRYWTRDDVFRLFAVAGLEVTSLALRRDVAAAWMPLPLDGRTIDVDIGTVLLKGLRAPAVEELSGERLIVSAARPASAPPACSIVMPVFNGVDFTRGCLETLIAEPPAAEYELIVVDNGSSDGTARYLASVESRLPLRVLRNPENLGFARACNRGAREARGEFLVFLNNDVVPHAGWLDELVSTARSHRNVGAVGSKLLYPDGTIQHAGIAYGPVTSAYVNLPYHVYRGDDGDAPHVNAARAMPSVTGASMLVPRRVFVKVGPFDERFRNGFEDVDFCLRVRAHGHAIRYCPTSVLTHFESKTEGRPDFDVPNLRWFASKWQGALPADDVHVYRADGMNTNAKRPRAWGVPPPPARKRTRGAPASGIVWSAALFDASGYADEARSFVLALDRAGVAVRPNPLTWSPWHPAVAPAVARRLEQMLTRALPHTFVHVAHWAPVQFSHHPGAGLNVGRSMFETDRLPRDWVRRCNAMDEIWVPSDFNLDTFARAGVDERKLRKVHEPIDVDFWTRELDPLPLDGADGFVFLSIFDWSLRKGWDALVRAYVEEFAPGDDVTLVLKSSPAGMNARTARSELDTFVRRTLGRGRGEFPRIVLLERDLGAEDLVRLYRAADAYVMPSRGEGWGRPYMEAMACGLPTIGTRWSGNLEFMNDENSYLVDCELVPVPQAAWKDFVAFWLPGGRTDGRGHRWAEPNVAQLRAHMRTVIDDRKGAAERAARGRRDVSERFGFERIARSVIETLESSGWPVTAPARRPRRVSISGTMSRRRGAGAVERGGLENR